MEPACSACMGPYPQLHICLPVVRTQQAFMESLLYVSGAAKRSRHFSGSSLLLGSRQSCLPFGPCVKNEGNVGTNLQKGFRTGVWKKPYIVFVSSPHYWIKNIYVNCHLLTAWSKQITELIYASISSSLKWDYLKGGNESFPHRLLWRSN